MLVLVARSCAGTSTRQPFALTYDPLTLGTGGGELCDGYRTYLTDMVAVAQRIETASSDRQRRSIAKDYFERAAHTTAVLLKLAPAELASELRSLHEGSVVVLAAVKKVDFDVTRLDASVLEKLADLDTGAALDGSGLDRYTRRTCHIDAAAFGQSIRVS